MDGVTVGIVPYPPWAPFARTCAPHTHVPKNRVELVKLRDAEAKTYRMLLSAMSSIDSDIPLVMGLGVLSVGPVDSSSGWHIVH